MDIAHMKWDSLLSSCQLALLVVVILLRWWGGSHARLVLRGEDDDEDAESVIAGALLSLLAEKKMCGKVACCEWCQHLLKTRTIRFYSWGLGISLGCMVLYSKLNMFWNVMTWICPVCSRYCLSVFWFAMAGCLFWFVGLSFPSGQSWSPVIGSSLACRDLHKINKIPTGCTPNKDGWTATQSCIPTTWYKDYVGVWTCSQHITDCEGGCWLFALRICFGLHWGGSALSSFLGQVDRIRFALRLPDRINLLHSADWSSMWFDACNHCNSACKIMQSVWWACTRCRWDPYSGVLTNWQVSEEYR